MISEILELQADTDKEDKRIAKRDISDLEMYRDYEREIEHLREDIGLIQFKMDKLIDGRCEVLWNYAKCNADYNDCLRLVE